MYGTNSLTGQCIYKTPCGWCARLDQECKIDCKTKSYKKCSYYKNDKCTGTKELDPCLQEKCDHMKF